jgi:glycosyltransferase involved in cell wall biosynthesis
MGVMNAMSSTEPNTAGAIVARRRKLLFLVTEDWYFVSHRLDLAVAARRAGYEVAVATRVDRHGDRIREAGLGLHPVDFNRGGLNPFKDVFTLLRIAAIYRREAPDIVHHVALKPVLYGSLVARLLGIGGIVNALGGLGYVFSSTGRRAVVLRWFVRPLMRIALGGRRSRLIVQNRDDRARLAASGLAKDASIRVIRGAGVDPDRYRAVAPLSDQPLVILPSRMLWEKGVGEFVAAARHLQAKGLKARFALVGSPDDANPASVHRSEIDAWVREGVVEYWGWRDDMPEVFAQAQIVCLPSYHEGLPKALLEAAASGCAMVATDIPGCREIVRQGVTGWLAPVRDIDALAGALEQAIVQPGLRRQYGEAGRALIAAEFSSDRVATETVAVYDELIA